MAATLLAPKHIFGFGSLVSNNIHYVDDGVLLYPAGHGVITLNTGVGVQKFVHATPDSFGITAIAVSPSKRYAAVAEQGAQRAVISVYDLHTLKRRKTFTSSEVQSRRYESMCFSADNKLLLTLSGAPDYSLVAWQWEKSKMVACIKCGHDNQGSLPSNGALIHCSCSPLERSVGLVTGDGVCAFYRVTNEGEFRRLPTLAPASTEESYLCHAWLPEDRVVVGTASGNLILLETGNFAGVLACSPANGVRINCIVTHSTGFVIGTDNGGVLLYDKSDTDGTQFSLMKTLNVLVEGITATSDKETSGERNVDPIVMACRVMNMTLSPTEDELVVTTSDHRMLKMNFTGLESLKETDCHFTDVTTSFHGPSPINDKDSSSSSVLFSSTANNANEEDDTGGVSIHTSAMVTGMDVCARKPLVATCGIDRYVRVWNYLTHKEEVKKMFPEEALSVAFHPSGLHVLVGFSDKLRLMNLLMDDIRVVTEFPIKACRECQFSAGGQVFAAANGHSIQLYRTYTAEPIALLRGHNSKVQSLHFTQHDTRLVSAGKDGAVYQWNITEGSIGDSKNKDSGSASSGMKREGEYVLKGCSYTHAIANIDGTLVYAVGSDSQIKEIEFQGNMTNATNPVSSDVGVMGQLAMPRSGRLLFTGTSKVNRPSMIMAMKVPLTGDTPPLPCLSGPVTRMCSAFDGSHIFVAGSDGCLIIYEVKEKDFAGKSLGAMSRDDTTGRPIYASEILVTRTDIEEQASAMREMQSKVDELHIHSEYQLRLKDMDANEKIKEVTEKFTQELEQDKNRYELLREEKNDMEMEFEEKIKHTEETHLHRLQQCEAEFQKQIMSEVERYQELVQEKDIQTQRWDQQQRDLIASHEQYTAEITEEYEQKLEEDRQARLHLAEERDELGRVYTETTKQLEEDIDTEIEELKKKYETKLNNEREATLRFKGENGIMKKKFSALSKDIEVQREDIKSMEEKEDELIESIKDLEKEIQLHKKDIHERDLTIGEKEKKIYQLKKKNQELEKFKFVLDYKIKDLNRQIEPRENEITDMKENITEMDHELEQYHKMNASLDNMIGTNRIKLDTMQKVIMKQRQSISDTKSRIKSFKSELHEVTQAIQEPALLKQSCISLHSKFVLKKVETGELDVEIKKEYSRQQEYLEKSVEALKRRLTRDSGLHRADNLRVMQANMAMVKEINKLRPEVKRIRMMAKDDSSSGSSNMMGGDPNDMIFDEDPASQRASEEATRTIQEQRTEIGHLKKYLKQLEAHLVAKRPISREQLPPIDGVQMG